MIWLDAHSDISNPRIFDNEHAMVVANLLQKGDPVFNQLVDHPLKPAQVFYAGLQEPTAEEQDLLKEDGIEFAGHRQLNLSAIKEWAQQNHFTQLYLHFDIDVLNPRQFYATYLNNPQLKDIPDNAAKGDAELGDVFSFIQQVNQSFALVGMTIAEYMPWSAQQLLGLMKEIPLFNK